MPLHLCIGYSFWLAFILSLIYLANSYSLSKIHIEALRPLLALPLPLTQKVRPHPHPVCIVSHVPLIMSFSSPWYLQTTLLTKHILPLNLQHSHAFGAPDVLSEWTGVAGVGWWEWSHILNRGMTYKMEPLKENLGHALQNESISAWLD